MTGKCLVTALANRLALFNAFVSEKLRLLESVSSGRHSPQSSLETASRIEISSEAAALMQRYLDESTV
jgi:hypothetical protein